MATPPTLTVIGAGPVGCVLATLLARRGHEVTVYEKRPDMRAQAMDGGRSINLVMTRRGLRALEPLGLRQKVLELAVPVLGRMMHDTDGELTYTPYGKDDSERNHSVCRGALNRFLLTAVEEAGAAIHFGHALADGDLQAGELVFDAGGERVEADADVVFGADGAPSAVRRLLVEAGVVADRVQLLDYGYKELTFPADADGGYRMEPHALHIWPGGWHMLMGLADPDGTFTGTVYLPMVGPRGSFEALSTAEAVRAFFTEAYPDAVDLLEDFEQEFVEHPVGTLGTVRCSPWQLGGRALLIGDAAHGIVPFFGQGLNSGFEDCAVLDSILEDYGDDLEGAFAAFFEARKANTDAIADMALENFVEMRDKVADDRFILKKRVETRIEQAMPEIYRSRYAMVMYSAIPYATARAAGALQAAILDELTEGAESPDEVDLDDARALIEDTLVPFWQEHEVDLTF